MRTNRMEQLAVIPVFGDSAFKLKRLKHLRQDSFDQWENTEKAVYYQIARGLIEEELESFDRVADMNGFRELLRNRYETFLAQSRVETRPKHMINTLFSLFEIADHEEGQGEGKKYLMESLQWINKIPREEQEELGLLIIEKFENQGEILGLFQAQVLGIWNDGDMLIITLHTLEALAEEGRMDDREFLAIIEATDRYLRKANHQEYVLRLATQVVQMAKRHEVSPEIKMRTWKQAFAAAVEMEEPYTQMLMSVLLGDRMKEEKDFKNMVTYLKVIDQVTAIYGEEATFGDNFDQIKEAIHEMKQIV
ncbi:hypothetical protein SANA_30250 [Gottschalkiaceae bacterium SANA]|nr:hypothetical protein SANA_30250 [Gottschalkiaceae bacterium SANA]